MAELLRVSILHLPGHQVEELWEINCPISISINLIDHVLKLSFCWVLSQRPHHSAKLLGGDTSPSPSSTLTVRTGLLIHLRHRPSVAISTLFDCGGIAIGALVSHMTVDGTAFSTFLNSWAATARGSCEAVQRPSFIAPSLFLQSDSVPKELTAMGLLKHFLKRGNCVARRFIFDASALATLKAKATSSCGQSQSPSRVQAVSSLIWKCFIAASKATSGAYKPILLGHAVNMRPRALPPFSESCMGNFLWLAVAECKDEAKTELHHLAGQVNDAIAKVNGDLAKQLQGEEGSLKYCETLEEMRKALHEGADYLGFTSWCNFGLYEVDFGWGKPTWASPVGSGESISTIFYQNMVILIETKQGDGIEAWISMDEQQMAIFQCDRELQIYASVDQSPLSLCN